MPIKAIAALILIIAAGVSLTGLASAQQGAGTPTPGAATPTSTPAAVLATATPDAGTGKFTISGRIVQDTDKDGKISEKDQPAVTLLQLLQLDDGAPRRPTAAAFLTTDKNGAFTFANLRPGEYFLLVWWADGFVGVQDASAGGFRTLPEQVALGISVSASGALELKEVSVDPEYGIKVTDKAAAYKASVQSIEILANPLHGNDYVPFPVRTGGGAVSVGTAFGLQPLVQEGEATDEAATAVSLPSAGDAGETTPWYSLALIAAGAAVVAGSTAGIHIARRRRAKA